MRLQALGSIGLIMPVPIQVLRTAQATITSQPVFRDRPTPDSWGFF
jgi:hypothetical protein